MGSIIKGIRAKPVQVTVHFRTFSGKRVVFLRAKLQMAQVRLMVKPGMMTDARPCQITVSTTAHITADRLLLEPSHCFCSYKKHQKFKNIRQNYQKTS